MASADRKLSQTIRIDLIPDLPPEGALGDKKKRIRVAGGTENGTVTRLSSSTDGDPHYQQLFQSIYDAAIVTDTEGRILDGNIRAVEFLQYARDVLVGLSLFDIVSGADPDLIRSLIQSLETERFALIQAYCIRQDGTFFPAEIAVNRLQLGDTCLCFFVRDITVRRQAEEMLRTEHNAIQNAGNGIAVANVKATLEYVNPALAAMWGCAKQEDLLGTDLRDLFVDRAAADAMVLEVMAGSRSWASETQGRRWDGRSFDVQISAACNRNSDGDTVGLVLSAIDISDRKRAEAAEREAERQRVMIESLGAACHHLGQPATVLLGNLSVMQKKVDTSDPAAKELVDMSIEAAEALGEILHRLNAATEYKTTEYLAGRSGSDAAESRIVDIR